VGGFEREVKVKKRCCTSRPRCKRCPVVMKRLAAAGLAERQSKRRFLVSEKIPKRHLKEARH
jgi:hypothetical protein